MQRTGDVTRRLLIALVAALLLVGLSGCAARKALKQIHVAQHLNAGLEAVQKQQGEKAVAELEAVLAVEPRHPEARGLLGKAYAMAGEYDKALPYLQERPFASRSTEDWFVLADVYDRVGNYDEAESCYREALLRASSSATRALALNNYGYMLANRHRNLDEALAMLVEANRRLPGQGFILDSLGWVYHQRGDNDRALRQLDRACRLSPDNWELFYHRAMILLDLDRRKEAVEAFAQAYRLDPEAPELLEELERQHLDPTTFPKVKKGRRRAWDLLRSAWHVIRGAS